MVSRNTTPFFDFIIFERYTSKQFNQEQGLALFPLTTVPIYIVSVPKIYCSGFIKEETHLLFISKRVSFHVLLKGRFLRFRHRLPMFRRDSYQALRG